MRFPTRWLIPALVIPMLAACGNKAPAAAVAEVVDPAFVATQDQWRAQRREELLQPDGWTTLVGLHWLELKSHYIGSSRGSGIRLSRGPERMGLVQQDRERVWFEPEPGVALTVGEQALKGRIEFRSEADAMPTVIGFDQGKGRLTLIERGGRWALRLRHADADTRVDFAGLEYWPPAPSWQVQGRFVPHPAGRALPIVDITGTSSDTPNPGVVEFARNGSTYRLEALAGEGGALFLVFADRTSGHGSYPAGRFLDAPPPDTAGKVMLDFNHAYNPPCAFTSFATCPLPPPENRLDLAIDAGEKNYTPPRLP